RGPEAGANGVALPLPGLRDERDVALRVVGDHLLDRGARVVGRAALDEDELSRGAQLRQPPYELRDVARLVATRAHHRHRQLVELARVLARGNPPGQAEVV